MDVSKSNIVDKGRWKGEMLREEPLISTHTAQAKLNWTELDMFVFITVKSMLV